MFEGHGEAPGAKALTKAAALANEMSCSKFAQASKQVTKVVITALEMAFRRLSDVEALNPDVPYTAALA